MYMSIFLSSHHLAPRDETRVVRLGGKHLYPLSRLVGPLLYL